MILRVYKEIILKHLHLLRVNQPILCFGCLLEQGWRIKGKEQLLDVLENGDLLSFHNLHAMIVHGEVRVI